MVERSSTDRLLGELVANVRNLENAVNSMRTDFVDLKEEVDGLRRTKWMGKGMLIVISGAGGSIMTKLPAILAALGK